MPFPVSRKRVLAIDSKNLEISSADKALDILKQSLIREGLREVERKSDTICFSGKRVWYHIKLILGPLSYGRLSITESESEIVVQFELNYWFSTACLAINFGILSAIGYCATSSIILLLWFWIAGIVLLTIHHGYFQPYDLFAKHILKQLTRPASK
jgi:hypothetical protein